MSISNATSQIPKSMLVTEDKNLMAKRTKTHFDVHVAGKKML